jgi:hypothetical protein
MFANMIKRQAKQETALDPFAGEPTELFCFETKRAPGHVRVAAGHPATLVAAWHGRGRVEVVVAGRELVVEHDCDGAGIRVVGRESGQPLAGFTPDKGSWLHLHGHSARRPSGARPGTVRLADGRVVQWVLPTHSDFECGFFDGPRDVLRYAYDGTAIFFTGRAASAGIAGASLENVALLVLGWLLLLDAGRIPASLDEFAEVPVAAHTHAERV